MIVKAMKIEVFFFIVLFFLPFSIKSNNIEDSNVVLDKPLIIRDPLITGGLSFLVPGGGQLYSKHYIKSGLFFTSEITLGCVAQFWHNTQKERKSYFLSYSNLSEIAPTKKDSLSMKEMAYLWNYDAMAARYNRDNTLSWFIGAYLFNILDGIECSNFFKNADKKEPVKAACFGIIPGGGQIYNGAFSKAGFIIMTQLSLGVISIHEHILMKEAEKRFSAIINMKDSTVKNLLISE